MLRTLIGIALVSSLLACGERGPDASIARCEPLHPRAVGTTSETLQTADGPRHYLLHVPASYTGGERVPLVLNFHGFGGNPARQNDYSGLVQISDANGFILVSPEGLPTMNGTQWWNNLLRPGPPYQDDVAFVGALLDRLEADACIDEQRIFATGMSNGALMSARLACSMAARIAAVAPVAGAYYPPLVTDNPSEPCPDTRPVPIVGFHGTLDPQVPFNGGPSTRGGTFRLPIDDATPAEDVFQAWAAHNGCKSGRQVSAVSAQVKRVSYGDCTYGADVQVYVIDGGGHTWPGSSVERPPELTTHDISASELMWKFFQAHPMRP